MRFRLLIRMSQAFQSFQSQAGFSIFTYGKFFWVIAFRGRCKYNFPQLFLYSVIFDITHYQFKLSFVGKFQRYCQLFLPKLPKRTLYSRSAVQKQIPCKSVEGSQSYRSRKFQFKQFFFKFINPIFAISFHLLFFQLNFLHKYRALGASKFLTNDRNIDYISPIYFSTSSALFC